MITDINRAPSTSMKPWPVTITWNYNGIPNKVVTGSRELSEQVLIKLLNAQVEQTRSNKKVPNIRYVKERTCRRK